MIQRAPRWPADTRSPCTRHVPSALCRSWSASVKTHHKLVSADI